MNFHIKLRRSIFNPETPRGLYLGKQQMADIIEFLPDATLVLDKNRCVIAWNRAIEKMTGIKKQDMLGKGDYFYMIPFYGKPCPGLVDLVFEFDEEVAAQYDFVKRDGHFLQVEADMPLLYGGRGAYLWGIASPLFDEKGQVVGAIESIRNISKRKQMEEEIKRHRNNLQDLVEERTRELQARTRELAEVNEKLQEKVYEYRKSEKSLLQANKRLKDMIELQKETEKQIRSAEERFRKVFKASPIIMTVSEIADGCYLDVNDCFYEATGFSKEEVGHSALELNLWCDQADRARMIAALAENKTGKNIEVKVRAKNGNIRKGYFSAEIIEVDGKDRLLTVWNDITELKETEKQLRSSEERFAKAFYANPNAMGISEWLSGRIILVNDSFFEITGYSREEVNSGSVFGPILWQDLAQREQAMLCLSQGGSVKNREIIFVCKNGEHRKGMFSAEIIELDGQKCMLSTLSDVTELKRMQLEVNRLERFNLVGQMAAGIGHEIRNPMTSVRGFLQILGSKTELVPYQGWINLMIEELDRANAIITEYLSLTKNKSDEYKLLNLNNILLAIAPLIEADALEADKYVEWILGEVPILPLNADEIRQLVLNLVRNGLEAITAGGRLIISTYLDMSNIVLAVRDNGGGIPQNILNGLGTPFVTTKESGTGLGLALCYAIAARHNAKIDVITGKEGTTFFVRFNIVEKELSSR